MIPNHTKEKHDMHSLTAPIPDDATLIRDGRGTVIGAVWRGEDGSGPWPGEVWKLASLHHGDTVSVRRTEAEAVDYVRRAHGA